MIHEANDNTATIETVERQFEPWRSSCVKKREPIPQHLWHAAALHCETHPITPCVPQENVKLFRFRCTPEAPKNRNRNKKL